LWLYLVVILFVGNLEYWYCNEGATDVLTESAIIIWKQKTDQDAPELPLGDNDITTKEQWLGIRVLRGHMEDVYDLSWSPDSLNLISGSVDNSAILWDVHKGIQIVVILTFMLIPHLSSPYSEMWSKEAA
jgi:WD40 repeat protein